MHSIARQKWLWVSDQCEAKCLIKTFLDWGWNFGGLITLIIIRDNDGSCSVDHVCVSGRPHTAFTITNIGKVKDVTPILLVDFIHLGLHHLSGNIPWKCFAPYFSITLNQLMKRLCSTVNATLTALLTLTWHCW